MRGQTPCVGGVKQPSWLVWRMLVAARSGRLDTRAHRPAPDRIAWRARPRGARPCAAPLAARGGGDRGRGDRAGDAGGVGRAGGAARRPRRRPARGGAERRHGGRRARPGEPAPGRGRGGRRAVARPRAPVASGRARRAPGPRRGALARDVREREYALAGVERAGRWLRLSAGRPPRACRAEPCEAVAIGSAAVPTRLRVRGVELRIVGRGWISPVPLGPVPPAQPALAAGATFLVTGWRARAAHELEGRF